MRCVQLSFCATWLLVSGSGLAVAHVGPGYILIEGIQGSSLHQGRPGWIRSESHYWHEHPVLQEIRGIQEPKNDLLFTGPLAPQTGPGMLALSVDKRNPDLPLLMALCRSERPVRKITFAESSELVRHPQEHGPVPADVPAYYRYRLLNVRVACPKVDDAPEQALTLHFDGIGWLNYRHQPAPRPTTATPAFTWKPSEQGTTRTFAVTWFAAAVDSQADQCPRMNTKPSQADYYALLSGPEAVEQHAIYDAKGGIGPDLMPFRGPGRMHVTLMPGIVADPGNIEPVASTVPGFDLDADDGSGMPPAGIRKHRNYQSPDGATGIDNQLFSVEGCVEGFRRRGFLPMIFNEGRAVGRPTMIIEISGIDDPYHDDQVMVSILYSTDDSRRSPDKRPLGDYTYRITNDAAFAQDFVRFRGRIADGIIVTEPTDRLHVHEVTAIETTLVSPRMRLSIEPDGRLKGLVGGYLDWRKRYIWQVFRASDYENTIGMQAPALYNALKRAADGLQDPATGEFGGISAAFEIEGVPAFTPPTFQRNVRK